MLRRFASDTEATSDSAVEMLHQVGDTVLSVIARIGIPVDELGSNLYLNGRYATLQMPVADGDRLGLFPADMQLLYKWYFASNPGLRAPMPSTGAPTPGAGDQKGKKEPGSEG